MEAAPGDAVRERERERRGGGRLEGGKGGRERRTRESGGATRDEEAENKEETDGETSERCAGWRARPRKTLGIASARGRRVHRRLSERL